MIVVTGVTGFIGSNLLAELEKRGYTDIVGIDSFGMGNKWKNIANRDYVRLVDPDNTFAFLNENASKIDVIIHLGAISSTTESNVDLIVKNNIHLSTDLYEFCKQHGISFIYASSAATYGLRTKSLTCDDNDSIEYLRHLRPMNPYGWSKHYVDKYISVDRMRTKATNQVVGLKFFNVYGPNEYHKRNQASVIYHFYRQLLEFNVARVFRTKNHEYPDGAFRDFVYVDDCVEVIIWMLEHKNVNGLFNVGTGMAVSYETIVETVARCVGKTHVVEYIEMPQEIQNQYQFYTEARLEKLHSVGYDRTMTSIQVGIERYCKYLADSSTLKYK
jgi:ADP-L-glycero-D-manno-heptose 6-epimerase